METRIFVLAFALTTSSILGAFAQGTGPDIKADSSREARDIKGGPPTSPYQPGATGSTIVPGNNSTIAGDKAATDRMKSGGGGGGGGK